MSLAVLFSSQGSQSIGMGRDLAVAWPSAAACFTEADAALGWSVSTTCWYGPEEGLNDTRQTQPCLFTTSLACLRALEEACNRRGERLAPAVVAGHSVGEYAALVSAGVLTFHDALQLVALRGRLMADADLDGGMTAVIGLERETVADAVAMTGIGGDLVLANDNAPRQVVISGSTAALERVSTALVPAGARRTIALRVSGPFHSPMMEPVGERLAAAFEEVTWHDADPPMVSNVTAESVRDGSRIRSLLARQVSSPVEWVRAVRRMVADGVDMFIECGPGGALTGMVRRIAPGARTLNVSDEASLEATVSALLAAPVGATA